MMHVHRDVAEGEVLLGSKVGSQTWSIIQYCVSASQPAQLSSSQENHFARIARASLSQQSQWKMVVVPLGSLREKKNTERVRDDGLMAWVDESKRGRTWTENKAQWWWGVCLAAVPADVVCEALRDVVPHSGFAGRTDAPQPRLKCCCTLK